jgi:sortase A
MRVAKVLNAAGRTCITAGALLMLFVTYQLWGTNLREAQAQRRLDDQFQEFLRQAEEDPPSTVEPVAPPPPGDAVAAIRIPKIGLDKTVVEGVGVDDLKKGPGHYPQTPLPGQAGNASIAGHRTTYGAPFNRIDELDPGDEIFVQTVQGRFRYVVTDTEGDGNGNFIVPPSQVDVLDDKDDNRLTLTACHPKYSAAKRIIVVAQLAGDRLALPARPASDMPSASLDDLDSVSGWTPVILLFAVCAGIWLFAFALARLWHKWPAYATCLPFFLVSLFLFFEEFSRIVPSNY